MPCMGCESVGLSYALRRQVVYMLSRYTFLEVWARRRGLPLAATDSAPLAYLLCLSGVVFNIQPEHRQLHPFLSLPRESVSPTLHTCSRRLPGTETKFHTKLLQMPNVTLDLFDRGGAIGSRFSLCSQYNRHRS